jgi:hypothetical protein
MDSAMDGAIGSAMDRAIDSGTGVAINRMTDRNQHIKSLQPEKMAPN